MKTERILLGIALIGVIATVTGPPHHLALAQGKKAQESAEVDSLHREYDYIEVGGELISRFEGTPIKRLASLALHDGKVKPVPFQIDERDPEGSYVMTGGKTAGCDADHGRLDGNDELVFLVSDAGDRLPQDAEPGCDDRIEIEVTDPRYPDRHAWVYLARYKKDAPRSEVDYIKYDPENDRVITECCIIGYKKPSGFMFYNDLIYKEEAGGNGKDMMDRIKFRFKIDFLGGKVTLERNEEMISSEVQGWIDGPVRVIRSTLNEVKLFDRFPSMRFDSISEYYPHFMSLSVLVRFPFDVDIACKILGIRSIGADVMGDFTDIMIGSLAYTNLDESGFTYTGHTPDKVLEKVPKKGIVWGFATKEGVGTWFPRVVFPDPLYQYNLYYITDDLSMKNPPEDEPGEIANGVVLDLMRYPDEFQDWLGTQTFELRLDTYLAPPGLNVEDSKKWLDILDYPLFVDVHRGKTKDRGSKNKKAREPPWESDVDGVITDTRGRKTCLKGMAYFIGSIEASPLDSFMGERIADNTTHVIPITDIRSIENHYLDFEPTTKTRNPLFSKVTLKNGKTLDLFSCKICGWAGVGRQGVVIYLSNAQVKRIDFKECEL